MTKSSIKTLICGVLAATATFGFSACSLEPESAYDIAVKYGYQGTEQEWLASLKGSDGKDAENVTIDDIYASWLKKDGNAGKSFDDFLKEYLSVDYNENNNTKQIAHNLNSVVSIYCGFKTTTTSSGWKPTTSTSWGLSAGSGVIYSLDKENGNAYIITNYHVVYESTAEAAGNGKGIVGNDNIFVYLYGSVGADFLPSGTSGYTDTSGKAIKATYVGGSMAYDIAVLKVGGDDNLKSSAAEVATFAKNGVTAGEKVYAIGNASGEGISVSMGAVSVESEYITMYAADKSTKVSFHVLRTDSAINPGNSGGGLFNAAGELVGIVNAKSSASSSDETTIENVGYALPASDVGAVAANIIEYAKDGKIGAVYKPYFGMGTQVLSAESVWNETGDKLEVNETLKVASVTTTSNGAGLAAGKLETGDKILAVRVIGADGEDKISVTLGRRADFNNALLYARAGDTIEVTIKRGLNKQTVKFENLQKKDFVEADEFAKEALVRLG